MVTSCYQQVSQPDQNDAVAGNVTESQNSSSSPLEYNGDNNDGDNEDEEENWNAAVALFTQHAKSLTQNSCDGGDSDDEQGKEGGAALEVEFKNECDDENRISNSSFVAESISNNPRETEYDIEFLHDDMYDEELSRLTEKAEDEAKKSAKKLPQKKPADAVSSSSSTFEMEENAKEAKKLSHATPVDSKKCAARSDRISSYYKFEVDDDAMKEEKISSHKTPTLDSKKRPRATLYESAISNSACAAKKTRRRASAVQSNTLTQNPCFTIKKKQKRDGDSKLSSASSAPRIQFKRDEVVLNHRMFKTGEVFMSSCREHRGFAFTLGEFLDGHSIEVKISQVWLKIENTFIAAEQAAIVKASTGIDWVLVKRHGAILENGMMQIKVRNLSKQLKEILPNETTALCYETDGVFEYSYYYECGKQVEVPSKDKKPCSMDLFAGGGGMSIGLDKMGFDVKFKVDSNQAACYTLMMNFPKTETNVFCEEVEKFTDVSKSGRLGVYPTKGSLDHIHGSPPCQGFSSANRYGGENDAQNNQCTIDFIEAIRYFEPSFVSMENVQGMTQKTNIGFLLRVVGGLLEMFYQVRLLYCSSSNFGDPQNRKRIILLAAKKGYKLPSKPKCTHGDGLLKIVTSGDALRDLEIIEPVSGSGLVQLRNGNCVWDHILEGTAFKPKNDKDNRLIADLPAMTIRKDNVVKHYNNNRYITVRERARLQSFPDDYRFAGDQSSKNDQIGNAVPVKLAMAVGEVLMDSFRCGRHEVSPQHEA